MKFELTTITPCWNRLDMLPGWVACLKAAADPQVRHLVYFVGEDPPRWWNSECAGTNIAAVPVDEPPGKSIGHWHNEGAKLADTEWIMKLDVDVIPNVRFFWQLLRLLKDAPPKEWFNVGMLCLSRSASTRVGPVLSETIYNTMMAVPRLYATQSGWPLQGTNFVCRREEYLQLGGCAPGFSGYGWEDYQQIWMLERARLGADPLPGPLDLDNVTQRCREEISRRKAKELHGRDSWLALFHKYHPASCDPAYRSRERMDQNKRTLLDYVNARR